MPDKERLMPGQELTLDELEAAIDGTDELLALLPFGRGNVELAVCPLSLQHPAAAGEPGLVRCFLTADEDFRVEVPHTALRRTR